MTPKQRKLVYLLFFSFLVLWLALVVLAFSSSGTLKTTIMFPSQFVLMLFECAAALASGSSMLLGLNLLGIDLRLIKPTHRSELPTAAKRSPAPAILSDSLADEGARRALERKRAFYLFGETEFEQCAHEFGYLRDVLKNKPIPDECFGCPRLVDCVKFAETDRKPRREHAHAMPQNRKAEQPRISRKRVSSLSRDHSAE